MEKASGWWQWYLSQPLYSEWKVGLAKVVFGWGFSIVKVRWIGNDSGSRWSHLGLLNHNRGWTILVWGQIAVGGGVYRRSIGKETEKQTEKIREKKQSKVPPMRFMRVVHKKGIIKACTSKEWFLLVWLMSHMINYNTRIQV